MKTFISLSALFLSLSLTAQTNHATWYLNDANGNGIQSSTSLASGNYSTAMGYETTASGWLSTAMGEGTTASGDYSTAMGLATTASGDFSTAMGLATTASGERSTAMGNSAIASDFGSLVIGQYNLLGSTVTNNAELFSTENTAFVIGNGTIDDIRSDALVVKFNGDATLAGSMTATSFIGDGSQLTNLPFSYNSNEAGGIEVADYTTASGSSAFAVGNDNLASGSSSTALGRGTIASGDDSTAMGANTEASGEYSTAMGDRTKAIGDFSTAMGSDTEANGGASTAMGYKTLASNGPSFAIGYMTAATGAISTSMGQHTFASGELSTALGYYTKSSDRTSLVIGEYNLAGSTVTNSATDFSLENTAFVIGNGTDENNRSDALTVLFDGTTTIAGDLNVNSDARLKSNIISLGGTLTKLLQIDGKSYTMKKDESEKQKIGLLAQDIEKVFPELVSESHGVKSVNYQGLVPVLINALKEQDAMMKEQDSRLSKQQSEIDELKTMLKTLIEKT